MKVTLLLLASTASVALSTRISRDGSCGGKTGQTCLKSGFGDCCSKYGYCGKSSAYCGTGCQAKFGSCTSSQPVPQPPALNISKNGQCGNGVTCRGSTYGDCCSQYGYCGRSKEYCGTGCNRLFGTCSQSPSSSKVIVVPTSTSKPAAPSGTATGKVSTNARCGYTYEASPGGMTCTGSVFGGCCSQYGYCGPSIDYCGKGCQSEYGSCNDQPSSSSSSSSAAAVSSSSSSSSSSSEAEPTSSTAETSSSTSSTSSTTTSSTTSTSPATPSLCTTNFITDPSFENTDLTTSPWSRTLNNPTWGTVSISSSVGPISSPDTGSSFLAINANWAVDPVIKQKLIGLKAGTRISCSFRYAVAGIKYADFTPDQPEVGFRMRVDGKPCANPDSSRQDHGWKTTEVGREVVVERDEPEVEITVYTYTSNGDLQAGLDNIEVVGVQECDGAGETPAATVTAEPTTVMTLTSSVTSSFSTAAPSATVAPTCTPDLGPCSLINPEKCCSQACANPGVLGNTNPFPACIRYF